MADSSLPVEILEVIFEDLISEYTKELGGGTFLPRWYLLPLLQVCKLWHLVCERYLYRSISLGNRFQNRWTQPIEGPETLVPARKPHMTTYALIVKLKGNSGLASLVEELHLHWQLHYIDNVSINLLLINICPNLRHVDLQSVSSSEIDILSEALAEKSLVSLRIHVLTGMEGTSFPIIDLMQSWPHIQTIELFGMKLEEHPQASRALNCCPELRQITLVPASLNEHSLASLRLMCSVVTKLVVRFSYPGTEVLDAFCGCLHAWSPTLEYLDAGMAAYCSQHPLSDAISSLTSLQELEVNNIRVDFGAISSFPRLKRLDVSETYRGSEVEVDRLAYLLEDPEKFAALIDIGVFISERNSEDKSMLRDVCDRRNIALSM